MGLLHITPDGDAAWHCAGKSCEHHNCADPLDEHGTPINCEHHSHLDPSVRPGGTALTAHISHEDIQWSRCGTMISLPECSCGTRLFAKCVFTDEELAMPNMTIPEYEEYQEQVVDRDNETLREALAKHGIEIPQRIHLVKQRHVVGEHQHPMVGRHQELARQIKEMGKHPPENKEGQRKS